MGVWVKPDDTQDVRNAGMTQIEHSGVSAVSIVEHKTTLKTHSNTTISVVDDQCEEKEWDEKVHCGVGWVDIPKPTLYMCV